MSEYREFVLSELLSSELVMNLCLLGEFVMTKLVMREFACILLSESFKFTRNLMLPILFKTFCVIVLEANEHL